MGPREHPLVKLAVLLSQYGWARTRTSQDTAFESSRPHPMNIGCALAQVIAT